MRRTLAGIAYAILAGSVALSVFRTVGTPSRVPAVFASLASYALIGYAVPLVALVVLGARSRRWPHLAGAVVAAAGLALSAAWLAPLFTGPGAGTRADLTVISSNLQFGHGDPGTVVAEVRRTGADVLVLQEITPKAVRHLEKAGLKQTLPYAAGIPLDGPSGVMVFARRPLTDPRALPISHGGLSVAVGGPAPFRLLAVHPSQPVLSPTTWAEDLRALRTQAASATRKGPTLVVGDLNSSLDHRLLRDVLAAGRLRDSAEAANVGWQPTWPTWPAWRVGVLPPVVAIDHVLVSEGFAPVSTSTAVVPGSDHRALVARLELRDVVP